MKVFAALLLCFLALKTSSQHIQAEDEQHREKRWSLTDIKLPSLDVSLLAFSLNVS